MGKYFGNNWKGISDQEIDDTMENADWVHDFSNELETLDTQDRNKKESNAQTKTARLAIEALGGTFVPPIRGGRAADDDDEEEEEPSAASASRRLPIAAIRGLGSIAKSVAKTSARGAMGLFDYALDTDGSRASAAEAAKINKAWDDQYASQMRYNQALTGMHAQAQADADEWARHVDKYALTPYDGPAPQMNENKPVDTKAVWKNAGAMGSHVLEMGEKYMLNNPGNAYLEGAGPVRGNEKGKKKK